MSYIANYRPKDRPSVYALWKDAVLRGDDKTADRLISPERPRHSEDCRCSFCDNWTAAYGSSPSYAAVLY